MSIKGHCLCGAVRYASSIPAVFMADGYCIDYRRGSGSGHIAANAKQVAPQINMWATPAPSWDKPAPGPKAFPGMASRG